MFYPFNPRLLRLAFFLCACASAALAALSASAARASGELLDWARAGISLGLLLAFGVVLWRLRPRKGYGVVVEPLTLTISRPLSEGTWQVVWSQVAEVRRDGKRKERLMLVMRPEGRLILQRHLFPSAAAFDTLTAALTEKLSPPRYDA